MRSTKSVLQVGIAAVLAVSCQCATAQFITQHSAKFGKDGLVTDTLSGLTWLNLTVTRGLSYNDVETQLASEPRYKDFRIASFQEVGTLFRDGGFYVDSWPLNSDFSDPARLAANASFADAFDGIPRSTPDGNSYEFFVGNTLLGASHCFNATVSGAGYTAGAGIVGTAFTDSTGPCRHETLPWMSTWVVSTRSFPRSVSDSVSPVPEPETYALMLVGLASVTLARRRRPRA